MLGIPTALADWSRDHYGIISNSEFAALGISTRTRQRLTHAGLLIPVVRGVHRLRSAPLTLEGQCRAVSIAHPTVAVTGRAAGRLLGLRRMGRDQRVEIRLPHFTTGFNANWVIERRCNVIPPEHVTVRADGIRTVTARRLAFDLAACLTPLDLESVLEQLLDLRLVTVGELFELDEMLHHSARPGSKRFRAVIHSRPAGAEPMDSDLEVRLKAALEHAGIRGLMRQHPIHVPGGWTIHADLAIPALRWRIEVDHSDWHAGRVEQIRDKQNDRQAGALGWRTDRVPDNDIKHRLASTVAELLAIYQLRSSVA